MVGCDYCLTDEHSMKVGQVVPNNRPEQTGILDHEKYASLILDSGSLVVKIYRRGDHPGLRQPFPRGDLLRGQCAGQHLDAAGKAF